MTRPIRLAVLISGGGTTLQNFIDRIASGELSAEVAAVIASNPEAYGLERARSVGIPAVVGTSVATAQIKDGDRVRVNGNTGLVEILANVPKAAPVGFKD